MLQGNNLFIKNKYIKIKIDSYKNNFINIFIENLNKFT
jgi:hypothetical protein